MTVDPIAIAALGALVPIFIVTIGFTAFVIRQSVKRPGQR